MEENLPGDEKMIRCVEIVYEAFKHHKKENSLAFFAFFVMKHETSFESLIKFRHPEKATKI